MPKNDKKDVIARAKAQNKPDRANVTFRLDTKLYDDFSKICDKEGVKVIAVLEALLKDFIDRK